MNNSNRFFSPLSLGEGAGVRLLFTLSLSLFSFASCTQASFAPDVPEGDDVRHEIALSGNMGDISGEVTPATRVDADPTKAMTMYFLRTERAADGSSWEYHSTFYSTYGILTATRAAGAGNQPVTFNTTQYYPMGKLGGQESANSYNDVSFYGWTGAVGVWEAANGGQINVTLNGTQDLMLSNYIIGSYTNKFTSSANTLTFKHLFAKITVQVGATDAAAVGRWGNITAMSVYDQPASCTIDGLVGRTKCNFSSTLQSNALEGFTAKALTTSYQTVGTLFIKPNVTSVKFKVTTVLGDVRDVTVTLGAGFLAGTAYTVTLDFKSTTIAPSASITAWTTGSASADL